jgi:hypothetical protein
MIDFASFTTALYQLYPTAVNVVNDGTTIVAYDVNGNIVEYDSAAVQTQADKNNCKSQATAILNSTDWTSIADVGDPTKANPYLINQTEFIAYRSTVRGYAVNPVVDPTWPTQPTEQWSS